ncbi:MAG: hypothetical protein EBR91_03170 [Flavobacteriia bacterium]|nr:hypothetical protein [Flavobacteriia bacterium]NBV68443.1 hypothetical protein [Flavobacteriia bacterium]NBV91151.1 hypothetical protein [Flavobacteriia bacterium]NBY41525.1 hypothetical protein [Flavobacteriia bacterium]
MKIQQLNGTINASDAVELMAHLVHLKIKYHEHRINNQSSEEDIKTREEKIKQLQKELFEFKKTFHSNTDTVTIEAILKIE